MKKEEIRRGLRAEGLPEHRIDKFIVWLSQNLDIWLAFVDACREKIKNGERRASVMAIIAAIRDDPEHKYNLQKRGDFKVSNSISPELVRLWRISCPGQYRDFLKTKPLKGGSC